MRTILSAVLITIISTTPVLAAPPANEAAPPSVAIPREQLSQEAEEMKMAIRGMLGELAKNRDLLQEMTRELLIEASRNKELLKEIIRGLAQNRETIRGAIRDLVTDKEIQNALREDRELIRELLEELSRTPPPEKAGPGKDNR
jgi:hypothetical protein